MAKFDDKINSLLNEFTTGISGMMNMSSDNLAPAKGWRYAHDEDEEKASEDHDGDGEVESKEEEYMGSRDKAIKKAMGKKSKAKGKKSKDEDAEDKTGHLSDKKLLKKVEKRGTMGKSTIKQAKKEIKDKGDVSDEMRKRMAADAYAKKK